MKGILISSEQIEWFIDMLCNSYGKEDVKDRILGALERILTEEQENYCFDSCCAYSCKFIYNNI